MLESKGIRCWIAPRDVLPSMEWGEAIIDAIEECRIMVLVFTANANDSPQIRREVERAVNHGVAILPVRIEDVLPGKGLEYFIGNVHWLDALTPPLEAHLRSLAGTIKILLDGWAEEPFAHSRSAADVSRPTSPEPLRRGPLSLSLRPRRSLLRCRRRGQRFCRPRRAPQWPRLRRRRDIRLDFRVGVAPAIVGKPCDGESCFGGRKPSSSLRHFRVCRIASH